jgi:hypothetical protein
MSSKSDQAHGTALHRIVQDHFETFLAEAAGLRDGNGVPPFVARVSGLPPVRVPGGRVRAGTNSRSGATEAVPRHAEIANILVKNICRDLGIPEF